MVVDARNTESLISVIIPTYNRADTIMQSINSVLHQTYQKIELIVVDDCSDDHTFELLSGIKDQRVRYIKLSERRGAPHARNTGVKLSTGEYIAFQDSDDIWHLDKLEKQMAFLRENDADMVAGNVELETENAVIPLISNENRKGIRVLTEDLLPNNFISTQTILGKRAVFDNIPFRENMPRFQDWLLALEITRQYKVYFDHRVSVRANHIRKDRISNSLDSYQIGLKAILDWVIQEYSKHPEEMKTSVEKMTAYFAEVCCLRVKLDNELNVCLQQVSSLVQEKTEILNSKSWCLTEPLRAIMRIVKSKRD